jgi:hypothetical protein
MPIHGFMKEMDVFDNFSKIADYGNLTKEAI